VEVLISTPDTMHNGHALRLPPILETDLAFGGSGGTDHPFKFKAGQDVIVLTIAILRNAPGIKQVIASG